MIESNIIYQKKYFGFVYIWRDSKRKMFYIGSHMGSIDDGYICSQKRMRQAYLRRPKTFKRRIIYYLKEDNRQLLLNEEQRWLKMISDEKLKKKYYNRIRNAIGFRSSQEISYDFKKHWADPVKKEAHIRAMSKSWTPERKKAHSEKVRKKWAEGNYKDRNNTMTPEGKIRMAESSKARYDATKLFTEETRKKMSKSAQKRANTPEYKERFKLVMKNVQRKRKCF